MHSLPASSVFVFLLALQQLLTMYLFFHSEGHGKLTVFSVKAMLATMCGGKILDKLRCKYFQFFAEWAVLSHSCFFL